MSVAMPPAKLTQAATHVVANPRAMSFASQFMAYLEQNPIAETLFKDVTGYNLPRLATVRTGNEFWDTLTGELSNTSITLSGTLLLPPLFQKLMAKVAGVSVNALRKEVTNPEALALATKMARLGSSLGYLNLWASLFWATPFFRNWLTLTRSKTANFENLIGLDKDGGSTGNDPAKLKDAKRFQLMGMFKVIGVGSALAAASVLGFGSLARKLTKPGAKPLSAQTARLMEWLFKEFDLKGDRANQVGTKLSTLIYWSLPAYFGWLQASRSPNEFKENLLKTVNSNLWFFCLTPLVSKAFLKPYQQLLGNDVKKTPTFKEIMAVVDEPLRQKLLSLKQKDFGIGMAITVLMLATTPQIINRVLTKRRFEKAQRLKAASQDKTASATSNATPVGRYSGQQSLIVSKNTLPFEFFLLNNR